MKNTILLFTILSLAFGCPKPSNPDKGVIVVDTIYVHHDVYDVHDSTIIHHNETHLTITDYKDSVTYNTITRYIDSVTHKTIVDKVDSVTRHTVTVFDVTNAASRILTVPNGANSDVIQAGALSAAAIKGRLYIPAGDYYVTHRIEPPNFTEIEVARFATIHVPAGFTGGVWYYGPGKEHKWSIVRGGYYWEDGSQQHKWSVVQIDLSTGENNYVVYCEFRDYTAFYALAGVDISLTGGTWCNSNEFDNINLSYCTYGFRVQADRMKRNWFDANLISKLTVQCDANTKYGLYLESGQENYITPYYCWDPFWSNCVAYLGTYCTDTYAMQMTAHFTADATAVQNHGYNNTWIYKNKNIGNQ